MPTDRQRNVAAGPDPLDALLRKALERTDDAAVRAWLEKLLASGERPRRRDARCGTKRNV